MKMIEIGAIVWGVQDIARAVRFWSAALHYKLKGVPSEDWAILIPVEGDGGSDLAEQGVVPESQAPPHRSVADYVVLQDPDGNPFCVVQR